MDDNPFDIYTEEYENWFKRNEIIFLTELLALKKVVPVGKKGVEIGIGSGIFAEKLNIKFGIDPSERMLQYARKRNIKVEKGFAEGLPYPDNSFDFAVFITSMCFIENPEKALIEANRIIKSGGFVIIAFIDKDSFLGEYIQKEKKDNKFYRNATLYSVGEMISLVESNHFEITEIIQTLTDMKIKAPENPTKGYGKGGFVVIKGKKN